MAETDSKVVTIDTDDLKVLIKISVLAAFPEDVTMEKLKSCMASLLEPYKDALVKANSDITTLKSQVADKETTIQKMLDQISELEQKYDDLEQHGRKGSVRIFGVPENTGGDTDTKVLHVVNTMMKLTPPPPPPPLSPLMTWRSLIVWESHSCLQVRLINQLQQTSLSLLRSLLTLLLYQP